MSLLIGQRLHCVYAGTDEEDNGMEMENDFEGEMFDVPKGVDKDDDKENEGDDEEELDREMGDLGDNGDVVDEKLWDENEDEDEEGEGQGEEKFEAGCVFCLCERFGCDYLMICRVGVWTRNGTRWHACVATLGSSCKRAKIYIFKAGRCYLSFGKGGNIGRSRVRFISLFKSSRWGHEHFMCTTVVLLALGLKPFFFFSCAR